MQSKRSSRKEVEYLQKQNTMHFSAGGALLVRFKCRSQVVVEVHFLPEAQNKFDVNYTCSVRFRPRALFTAGGRWSLLRFGG